MLFLQHLATKMRPVHENGGRAAIVLNGSPLFTGGAESGPSEIRRWLLEKDWVDTIVALPTNMFYNTGIATYVWILDNAKPAERIGKVQLIDGTSFFTRMRRNLGAKNREISAADRTAIVSLYDDYAETEHSKIFTTDTFGYWTITVERPLLDDAGKPITDRKGARKPDPKLRDTENVPFTYGASTRGAEARDAVIKEYLEAEVLPHVPDAWVDHTKTKVGYEIPFTRQFYKYVPPRSLAEIDGDLNKIVSEILVLLREVES
jgi:type I restriction enzyme M protein